MEPIVIFLIFMGIATLAGTAFSAAYAVRQAKIRKRDPRVITYKAYSVVVGVLSTSIGLTGTGVCLFFFTAMGILATLFLFAFALLGIYLILQGINWKLEVRDNCLLYRNAIAITRQFDYRQIHGVRIFVGKETGLVKGYEIYAEGICIKIRLLDEVYHLRNFKNYLTEQLKAHESPAEMQFIKVGP